MKVMMVRDTPPYGHAPTYQISLTYLERQKCYDKLNVYAIYQETEKQEAFTVWYKLHLHNLPL
jgi:hypothetical protein